MSAFDKGFSFGLGAWQQAMDNKRQDEKDERAKKEFSWKEKDRARVDDDRAREDAAWGALGPASGIPAPAPAAPQAVQAPAETAAPAEPGPDGQGQAAPQAPAAARGLGLPQAAPAAAPMPMPVQQGVAAALAPPATSRAAQLRALEGIAVARRDAGSLERLGAARHGAEEDDFIAQAMKGYTGADDQIGATALHINGTSKSITMGAPDKDGVVQLAVVTPDRRAQFMSLSRDQQARLYAAGQLMERNPIRAFREIADVNRPLAEALAAESGLLTKVAGSNNQAAFKARDDDRADRQQAEAARHNRASEAIASARAEAAAKPGSGAFDPQAGFDNEQAYKTALDIVRKESEGGIGGKMDPKQMAERVQAVYGNLRDTWAGENIQRQRANAFTSEAKRARTPEEVEGIRARALERGYTDAEMARLDPRFARQASAVAPAPGASPPAPSIPKPVPSQAVPPARGSGSDEDAPAGRALDAAKLDLRDAIARVRTFGLAQRAADPSAYQAAVDRVRAAEAAAAQAEAQWQSTIARQGVGAYFGGSR